MKTTGKDLWEAYQNLPKEEKIKFESFKTKSKEKLQNQTDDMRKEILERLMNIKREDGSPYFYKEYLEKNILYKND